MKETKVKLTPHFLHHPTPTDHQGLTTMEMVGSLPEGGMVVLTLADMDSNILKQLVKVGLVALQTRRDRALRDVEDVRFCANQ